MDGTRSQPNAFEQRCIDAYRAAGGLDAACAAAGVHKFTMFKVLKFKGLLRPQDGLAIGSAGSRLGASAELEFARLVPAAKSMNTGVVNCHPGYDFFVDGWRVSVKACSPLAIKNRVSERLRWQAVLIGRESDRVDVDVFCVFLVRDKGVLVQDTIYKTYLIPTEMLAGRKSINKVDRVTGEMDGFEVAPLKLAGLLAGRGSEDKGAHP